MKLEINLTFLGILSWYGIPITTDRFPHDYVAMHKHSMDMLFGVPFHHFFFLKYLIISILSPPTYFEWVGSYGWVLLLWGYVCLVGDLSTNVFQSIYHLVEASNKMKPKSLYYLCPRTPKSCPNFVITLEDVHNWNDSPFFVRGNCVFQPNYLNPLAMPQ